MQEYICKENNVNKMHKIKLEINYKNKKTKTKNHAE